MITETIKQALLEQITAELNASQAYLQMSYWCSFNNLDGFAKFLKKESESERCHSLKFCDYIDDQLSLVELSALESPRKEFISIIDIFKYVNELEHKVTGLINNLVKLAMSESDFATVSFLQWFVDEQIKAEREISLILNQLEMIEGDNGALLFYDSEISKD